VDNGYGYDFVPVTGNGYEFEYMKKVTGTDVQCYYPRIVYSLPSLSPPLPLGANKNQPGWNQDVTIVAEIRTDWIRKQRDPDADRVTNNLQQGKNRVCLLCTLSE
jgi:hypothetical protein